MSIISRLAVVLGLDSAEFTAGLGKADNDLKKFGASSVAAGATLAAVGTALVTASYQAITFADGINDIAKANDLAVSTVLEFSQALSTNGGKAENATKLIASLTNKIDDAAQGSQKTRDKFAELGVSLEDLGNLSEEDLLRKTIEGLAKIPDSVHRNAMAFDLLGKSMKGVDIIGLNAEFEKINGTMNGSDAAFTKIGNSVDALDRLSQKIKIDLANNLADPFEKAIEAADKFYKFLSENSQKLEKERHQNRLGLAQASVDANMGWHQKLLAGLGMGKEVEEAKKQAETSHYTPMDTNWDYKPNLTAGNSPVRPIAVSDEEEKRRKAAQKLRDGMYQQSLELERQIELIGQVQTNESKVAIEFKEGGKYVGLQNTELGKRLIADAKSLDLAEQKEKLRQEAIAKIKAEAEEDKAASAQRSKDVAQMAIKQAETYQIQVETAQLEKERLDYSTTLIGQSDTQIAKAMALFDIEKEMIRIKKENPYMSPTDLDNIKNAKIAVVDAQETNTRAANTFQAGWDKALSNYSEKIKDSAALGAGAFNSMASSMTSALDTFVETGKISFSSLISSMIKDLLKMQLQAQASGFFGQLLGLGKSLIGGGGMPEAGLSFDDLYAMGTSGFADGGNPPVGVPSLVGERGAELFVPRTAGTIVPNHALSAMMGNQPQTVYNGTVVQNMQAIDTQSAAQFLARNKQAVWSANMSASRSLPMSR